MNLTKFAMTGIATFTFAVLTMSSAAQAQGPGIFDGNGIFDGGGVFDRFPGSGVIDGGGIFDGGGVFDRFDQGTYASASYPTATANYAGGTYTSGQGVGTTGYVQTSNGYVQTMQPVAYNQYATTPTTYVANNPCCCDTTPARRGRFGRFGLFR